MTLAVLSAWVYVFPERSWPSAWAWPHPPAAPLSISSARLASTSTNCPQAVGGTIWHGVKGFRNSPYGERRLGAITAIKMRAPVLGGNFGVWGGMFSTFDCAVKGIRKKEDAYVAEPPEHPLPWLIANIIAGTTLLQVPRTPTLDRNSTF